MAAARIIRSFAQRLVEYADQGENTEFVIPEDLSALTDEELNTLHSQAVEHFDALFNDGQGLSEDDVAALEALTVGIESLSAEQTARQAQADERSQRAAELAARAHPEAVVEETEEDAGGDGAEASAENEGAEGGAEGAAEGAETEEREPALVAGGRREIRVNLSGRRTTSRPPAVASRDPQSMRDLVFAAGEGLGVPVGTGVDWGQIGEMVDRRLTGFQPAQFAAAAANGRQIRQQHGLISLRKPTPAELVIDSADPAHVEEVMLRAVDESRLRGGSLVAAGGWCAPVETLYDLCELESRDGLYSLPTVGVGRAGIQWTLGPNFSTIYSSTGWNYTEQDVIDGDFDGNGGGSKPCFEVDCPSFTSKRLDVAGLCIQAGLLQQRGYPELIARTVRGALVAHDHRMAANVIAQVETGSTAVTMTAAQVGATAPLLSAIELQVEHFRYTTRLARSTTLEAVFPYWVRGVIRSDLSRRMGIDLLGVTDSQIDGWFRLRGINPQFIYNWQDINGTAINAFVAWPSTVKFLLYAAGTWVQGGGDLITMDTLYDSTLLGENKYTALFTEESWLVAKRCHDSRVVTVALAPSGGTHGGVEIAATGPKAP